ncbi:SMI1/KNR4 family protein [Symmachiella macrocystis]|nr:SMI1/KNR4 family protein [Symmachiella macrocystis]
MSISEMHSHIDAFPDKQCGAGANDDDIASAETALGIQFPESYRSFLRKVGWGEFSYELLYGLGMDTPDPLGLVRNTLSERHEASPPLPLHFLPVMNDGAGNNYCLDTSRLVSGECPVVFWDHEQGNNQTPDVEAESFDLWLIELLEELLQG